MEAPHWIVRVMDCVSSPRWWDGLILGIAATTLPFILWLWITGN